MIFEQFSRISIFVRKMLTMFELQSKNPFSVSELFLNLLCIIFQSYEMFIDANQSRKVNPIEIMTQIKKSKNNQTKKTGKIRLQKRVGNQRPYFPFFFNLYLSFSLLHQTCYDDFFSDSVSLLYDVAYR